MENENMPQDQMWKNIEKSHRRGKVMGGLLIIAAGSLFLARELGAQIPQWVFTWKMLLIAIGIVLAIKHKFMHPGWIILVAIGGLFLVNDFYPDTHIRPFFWPVVLIIVGLIILFKPKRRHNHRAYYMKHCKEHHHHGRSFDRFHNKDWHEMKSEEQQVDEDSLDATSFMAGIKKNIISKKFKGGTVVNIFGGAHLDLTQADFEGTATLEITQIFGGTKLLVPANWEIKSPETVTICGGIEDKRPLPAMGEENKKVLLLIGTTVFGGIEIKSY